MDASWRALTITVLLSLVGGATWAPFASTPKVSGNALNYSDADITWQMNANNIAQVAATPVAAYILTRHDGLRGSVFFSAATLLLQCGLFAVVVAAPSWVPSTMPLFASVAGGVNCAFVQGVPTMISAVYFPPAQRGRTTAIMYVSTYIGVCASYLGYAAVEHSTSFKGFQYLLYCEAGLAFLLLVATGFVFPAPQESRGTPLLQRWNNAHAAAAAADDDAAAAAAKDDNSAADDSADRADADVHARDVIPSDTVDANRSYDDSNTGGATPSRLGFAEGLLHCLRQPSVVLLIVAAAAINGTLTAWQGVIPILFRDLGNATANNSVGNATGGGGGGNGFKSSRGDVCSLISSLGYAIGGYFGGELGDRCFAGKLKTLLVICISLGAATYFFIVLLIPPAFFPSGLQIHVDGSGPDGVYALLLSFSLMSGACLGGTMPVALEVLAETAYPVAEGITANATLFLTQLFCFALTALVPIWSAQAVTFAVLAATAVCLILTLLANPTNNRRKAQLKAAAHDAYRN